MGKAKSLKSRLLSYRQLQTLLPKTRKMLFESSALKFRELETEIDALILEAELIRRHQPPYNSLLKDDKSPLYIVITKEPFPKVLSLRKTTIIKSPQKYRSIFGPYSSSREAKYLLKFCRSLFPFCNASDQDRLNHKACFYYHLHLCPGVCLGKISQLDYQQSIYRLTQFLKGKRRSILKVLKSELNQYIKNEQFEDALKLKSTLMLLLKPQSHLRYDFNPPNLTDDLAYENQLSLLNLLKPYLNLPPKFPLTRVEAYDISHLQGNEPTASMVVFENGQPNPSAYRRFRIKTIQGINDPSMLVEALNRRLHHPEWPTPQLIVLDGGKSQLTTVHRLVNTSIPIISIAKKPDRIFVYQHQTKMVLMIKTGLISPGFRMIQAIRDEAHRFTKKYHTLLHNRTYQST